jgi:hypothetical protein
VPDKASRVEAHQNGMSMARQQRMGGSAVFNSGGNEWWPTMTRGGFLQVGE